jgi:hypothetical protein
MTAPNYDETAERRRFLRGAREFYTDHERAVFFAVHAYGMRQKSRYMLTERREQELAEIADALPLDDPMVADALRDGFPIFVDRVADRIWEMHGSEFTLPRCPECNRIVKTSLAKQCLWCGHDWH